MRVPSERNPTYVCLLKPDDTEAGLENESDESEVERDTYQRDDKEDDAYDDDNDDYTCYLSIPCARSSNHVYDEHSHLKADELGLIDPEYWEWPVWEHTTCFGLVTVRKIGNIVVLAEWVSSDGKPKRVVVGPYW